MRDWIAIGRDRGETRAFHMHGDSLLETASKAAPGDLPNIRIGEGAPANLPAPVLPQGGSALPGFAQSNPPDVIGAWPRLWIMGYLAQNPGWDGVICALDGDVSHWIHISADEAVSCQSFLTSRLIGALGGATMPDETDLANTLSRPERLAAHLRMAQIAGDPTATTGALLGAELAAARPYWLGQNVALLAEGDLATAYATALKAQSVPTDIATPETLLPAGLAALGRALGFAD